MKKNIHFTVSNGVTGETRFDAMLDARMAQALADSAPANAVLSLRHIPSGDVVQQVGNGAKLNVPTFATEYPVYAVEVYVTGTQGVGFTL
jgi:FAD synthase